MYIMFDNAKRLLITASHIYLFILNYLQLTKVLSIYRKNKHFSFLCFQKKFILKRLPVLLYKLALSLIFLLTLNDFCFSFVVYRYYCWSNSSNRCGFLSWNNVRSFETVIYISYIMYILTIF